MKFVKSISEVSITLQISLLFIFLGCSNNSQLKKIEFDWSKDYRIEIASGINPKDEYSYWALIRSDLYDENDFDIIYEYGKRPEKSITGSTEPCLLNFGIPYSECYYFVYLNQNGLSKHSSDVETLLDFFGKVDTMEEALFIALMDDYYIYHNTSTSGLYRTSSNGFEFQLINVDKEKGYRKRHYLINVDEYGKLTIVEEGDFLKPSLKP